MLNNYNDVYIERCDKESENLLANETETFLSKSISYLKAHKNEFIYLESSSLEQIQVDAISFEIDDVFGTYDVLLGLKFPKKMCLAIKSYLDNHLHGEMAKFELMFNNEDGVWDVNFALNYVDGFKEDMTFFEAFDLIYSFLANLVKSIKEN